MEKLQAFHGALNLNADAVRKGRISNGNLGSAKKTQKCLLGWARWHKPALTAFRRLKARGSRI